MDVIYVNTQLIGEVSRYKNELTNLLVMLVINTMAQVNNYNKRRGYQVQTSWDEKDIRNWIDQNLMAKKRFIVDHEILCIMDVMRDIHVVRKEDLCEWIDWAE